MLRFICWYSSWIYFSQIPGQLCAVNNSINLSSFKLWADFPRDNYAPGHPSMLATLCMKCNKASFLFPFIATHPENASCLSSMATAALSSHFEGSKLKKELLQSQKKKGKKTEREFEGNKGKKQSGELIHTENYFLTRQNAALPLSALLHKTVEAGASLAYKWRTQTFFCSIICCKASHSEVSRELRVFTWLNC